MAAILGKLSKRERVLIYILLILVIITAMFYFLVKPAADRNSRLATELLNKQSEEMVVRHNISSLENQKTKTKELHEIITKENEEIFPILSNDEVDLLVTSLMLNFNMAPNSLNISNAYLKQMLSYGETKPQDENDVLKVYTSAVTVKLSGTLTDLVDLLDHLENVRSIRVINYSVSGNGKGTMGGEGENWTIPVVITLSMEIYMGEEGTASIDQIFIRAGYGQ